MATSETIQKGFEKKNVDWATVMAEDHELGRLPPTSSSNTTVILPTAPKALRSNEIDTSRVPNAPPFKAYIGNIPYDADEDALREFFSGLRVKSVNLPREDKGNGKTRGFGYAEFDDRESLIEALRKHGEAFNGRTLRVSLPEESGRDERRPGGFGGPGGNMGDDDRTMRDWRTGPPKSDFGPSTRSDAPTGSWRTERTGGFSDSAFGSRMSSNRDGGFRNGFGESRFDSYASRHDDRRGFDDRRGGGGGFDRPSRSGGFESSGFDRFDRAPEREVEFSRDNMRSSPIQPIRGGSTFSRDDLPPRPPADENPREFYREKDEHRPIQRQYSGQSEETRYDSDRLSQPHDTNESRTVSPPQPEGPKQRPRLNLQKRTVPLEEVAAPAPVRSSIFGDAKPVDTTRREKEIEEKLKTLEVVDEPSKEEKADGTSSSASGRIRKISSSSSHSHSARSRKESESDSRHEDYNFQESNHPPKRGSRPFDSNRRGGSSNLPSGPRGGDRRFEGKRFDRDDQFVRRDDRDSRDQRRPVPSDHRPGHASSDNRRRDLGDRERPHRISERPPRDTNNLRNENRKDPVSELLT